MLKKLVTGQLSLPMTFWGWGFCGGLVLGLIGLAGIHTTHAALVPLSYLLKIVLFCAVLSGVTFILRRKITVFGSLAFLVFLVQVILNIIMFIGLYSLFFIW
ncbi:hypothetical protein [Kluyvera sp. 142486]|uniref:hypothetical protein n=1 Tax=Kluyvera sp. 142486 TaxID=3390050 RepID=UPI003980A31E